MSDGFFDFGFLFRKKKVSRNDAAGETKLARVLNTLDLTALGIGSTLGENFSLFHFNFICLNFLKLFTMINFVCNKRRWNLCSGWFGDKERFGTGRHTLVCFCCHRFSSSW